MFLKNIKIKKPPHPATRTVVGSAAAQQGCLRAHPPAPPAPLFMGRIRWRAETRFVSARRQVIFLYYAFLICILALRLSTIYIFRNHFTIVAIYFMQFAYTMQSLFLE